MDNSTSNHDDEVTEIVCRGGLRLPALGGGSSDKDKDDSGE